MKIYFKLINIFVKLLITILSISIDSIIEIVINKDYNIIRMLNSNEIDQLTLSLIGFEVTLIAIYFVFLPIVIENKNKNFYLGHKISKWILYDRTKKNNNCGLLPNQEKKKNDDLSSSWIKNITIIMLSILFYILNCNLLVILLFMLFITLLNRKVLDYLRLISNEEYIKEIEHNFLELCKNDRNKICDILSRNKEDFVTENMEILSFILRNYEVKNMDYVYNFFYKELFKTNNMETIYMMYNEISNEIERRKEIDKKVYFQILPWDFNYLLLNGVNESNLKNTSNIIYNILTNHIEFAIENNDNYNELLSITYRGILNNSNISEEKKHNLLERIILIVKLYILNSKNDSNFTSYKCIFNLFRYFIEARDNFGIRFMLNTLEENIIMDKQNLYSDILITLMVYLYYLIKIENPPYIDLDEKQYLNQNIYEKLKIIVVNNGIEYCYNYNIDRLFNWIKKLSLSWEKYVFKEGSFSCIKTPMCDNAVITSQRALFIIYKGAIGSNNKGIEDKDLSLFRFTIEEHVLKKDVLNDIKKFTDFIGFHLSENTIKNYTDSLLEYANSTKKGIKRNYNNMEYYKKHFKAMEKSLSDKISKLEIFNGTNTNETLILHVQLPKDKSLLEGYIGDEFLKLVKLDNIIEKKILDIFSNIKLTKVEYTYNTDKKIFNKLKLLKKKYYYIRPSNDVLAKEYKYGDEYLKTISKFNIKNTNVGINRFLIDDYKCELKKLFFEIRELEKKEVFSFINQYKKGKKYYIKDDYGYEIEYTKKEIYNYCKSGYLFCNLILEIGIDVNNSKGYKFVLKK